MEEEIPETETNRSEVESRVNAEWEKRVFWLKKHKKQFFFNSGLALKASVRWRCGGSIVEEIDTIDSLEPIEKARFIVKDRKNDLKPALPTEQTA